MVKPTKLYARLQSRRPHRSLPSAISSDFWRRPVSSISARVGSHHHYVHPDVPEVLTVQPDGKDAKRYQVTKIDCYCPRVRIEHRPMMRPALSYQPVLVGRGRAAGSRTFPDLRYCSAHGDTPAEAVAKRAGCDPGLARGRRAIAACLVPEPRYRAQRRLRNRSSGAPVEPRMIRKLKSGSIASIRARRTRRPASAATSAPSPPARRPRSTSARSSISSGTEAGGGGEKR